MFQLAGLLIFFGFGSIVLFYLDYEFKVLSWLTEYQPVAGVAIGMVGLAVLVLAFWLRSRKDDTGDEPGSAPVPAGGRHQAGPGLSAQATQQIPVQPPGGTPPPGWAGPSPQQAYVQRQPAQPQQLGPYGRYPQSGPQAPQPMPAMPQGPQQQVPPPRYAVPPQQPMPVPQQPMPVPQPGQPGQLAAYPQPPYPPYQQPNSVNGVQPPPPYGGQPGRPNQ